MNVEEKEVIQTLQKCYEATKFIKENSEEIILLTLQETLPTKIPILAGELKREVSSGTFEVQYWNIINGEPEKGFLRISSYISHVYLYLHKSEEDYRIILEPKEKGYTLWNSQKGKNRDFFSEGNAKAIMASVILQNRQVFKEAVENYILAIYEHSKDRLQELKKMIDNNKELFLKLKLDPPS
ncbi:MAG: hypothetical protein J7L62_00950 [Candidatus Aminicenantes bacterium]|nr:hypothetical protein [Candidatus Aminicenantes bacterium]